MTWTVGLEILGKTSVIAGTALVLSMLLAFRPARDRVDVLRSAVCLLVLLPVFLLIGPSLPLAWLEPSTVAVAATTAAPQAWTLDFGPVANASLTTALPQAPSATVLAVIAYVAGVALLLGRFLLGLWMLRQWTAQGAPVRREDWKAALNALDPSGRTRLIASDRVRSPLSWGLPPGVVLLDADCLTRPASALAVLAHELAHIRRGDWLFLALSRVAVALFWFNPLVWALHAVLAALTEEAADAAAVAQVDRRAYARVLVDMAAETSQPAALAMAGHPKTLSRRIAHIMKTPHNRPARPLAMTLAIGALVAVATPLAAVELVPRAPVPPAPPAPPAALTAPLAPLAPLPPLAAPGLAAPPAQPAPPRPPVQANGSRYVITTDGRTRSYSSLDEMDAQTRREFERAHAEGERARAHAEIARKDAERVAAEARAHAAVAVREGARARAEGLRAAHEARAHAEVAMREGERAREVGLRAARDAHAQAEVAQREARAAMVEARASMRSGADNMVRGAEQMRSEGRRLRDADYRAEVIAENRARGNTVTDAELIELSRSLPRQADDLERQARRMRDQASRDL